MAFLGDDVSLTDKRRQMWESLRKAANIDADQGIEQLVGVAQNGEQQLDTSTNLQLPTDPQSGEPRPDLPPKHYPPGHPLHKPLFPDTPTTTSAADGLFATTTTPTKPRSPRQHIDGQRWSAHKMSAPHTPVSPSTASAYPRTPNQGLRHVHSPASRPISVPASPAWAPPSTPITPLDKSPLQAYRPGQPPPLQWNASTYVQDNQQHSLASRHHISRARSMSNPSSPRSSLTTTTSHSEPNTPLLHPQPVPRHLNLPVYQPVGAGIPMEAGTSEKSSHRTRGGSMSHLVHQTMQPWKGSYLWKVPHNEDEQRTMELQDARSRGGGRNSPLLSPAFGKSCKSKSRRWFRVSKPYADRPAMLLEFIESAEGSVPVSTDVSKVLKIVLGGATHAFQLQRTQLKRDRARRAARAVIGGSPTSEGANSVSYASLSFSLLLRRSHNCFLHITTAFAHRHQTCFLRLSSVFRWCCRIAHWTSAPILWGNFSSGSVSSGR